MKKHHLKTLKEVRDKLLDIVYGGGDMSDVDDLYLYVEDYLDSLK